MTKQDVTDEQLTFYYYKDGLSPGERQKITTALAIDAGLAARYQRLSAELTQMAVVSNSPPPADMTARWHDTIKTAARRETPARPALHTWSFIWGSVVTAALVVGIGIGMLIPDSEVQQPTRENITLKEPASAYMRGLQVHLRESEAGLANLAVDTNVNKGELVMEIIQQNRLFEKAAEHNGDQSVARVLRAFELVLMRIAAEETSADDAEELRAKLLFELNIMLTKLSREASEDARTI